jgi:hypothetical protein
MKISFPSAYCRIRSAALFSLAACAVASLPVLAGYQVETIAISGPTFDQAGNYTHVNDAAVSINDSGTVAFEAKKGSTSGVYVGSGGALTTIATATTTGTTGSTVVQRYLLQPVINNAGLVAWFRYAADSGSWVHTGTGGTVNNIARTTGAGFETLGNISIATNGRVTFYGGFGYGSGGIYSLILGEPQYTVIASSSGPEGNLAGYFDLIRAPHCVSRAGTAAFRAYFNAVDQYDWGDQGIFTGSGSGTTTVADNLASFASFADGPTINDSGTVAFIGDLVAPDPSTGASGGVFLVNGGAPALILPATAQGLNQFNSLCLANNGSLSFTARAGETIGRAIYVRSAGGSIERIIGYGDPLAGSTVTYIYASRTGLNESGQVAFYAGLANSKTGVFRATVAAPGSAPDAADDLLSIRGSGKLNVLANDTPPTGGTMKITAVSAPAKGKATISAGTMITYTPGKTFNGTDTFTYTVTGSGNGFIDTATVTVTNTFWPLFGAFSQLITNESGVAVGTLTATLTNAGALSGKVLIDGKTYTLRGAAGIDGTFTQSFKRTPTGTPDLVVTLLFALDEGIPVVSGSISGDPDDYAIAAGAVSLTALPAGVEAGAYTILLPPDATASNPRGVGYATGKVTTAGKLTLAGKLADGTAFTAASVLNAAKGATIFVPLYVKPKGSLAGTLTFATAPSRFTGLLAWQKPLQLKPTGVFQAAFSATTQATGSRYVVVKNTRLLTYTEVDAKGDVHLRGGGFADIDAPVTVTIADKVTADSPNANLVKLTITRTTGVMSGSFLPAVGAKAVKFYGILHQGENRGAGFFLSTSQSGTVELDPR